MAYIDGGYTTAKNVVKDLANILTSANAKLNATITDEARTVEDVEGDLQITLKHIPLNNTMIFKKATDNSVITGLTFTVSGSVVTFTNTTPLVTDAQDILVTYDGDRDWKIIFPTARAVDDDLVPLTTPEAIRLDQVSRINTVSGDRVILKTTTTPTDIVAGTDPFSIDPNLVETQKSMYIEIKKPIHVVNPENGASSYRNVVGSFDGNIQMVNNHYITIRMIDEIDELTGALLATSKPSEWSKFSWFMDFREAVVDDYDSTATTGSLTKGYFLRPITMPSYYDDGNLSIQYWINTNNDRTHIVLMGNPDIDVDNYLVSYAYIGRIEPFTDKITGKSYFNDVVGNFALTVGSSTIPCKQAVELTKLIGTDGYLEYVNGTDAYVYRTQIDAQITLGKIPIPSIPADYSSIKLIIVYGSTPTVPLLSTDYSVVTSDPDDLHILLLPASSAKWGNGAAYKLSYIAMVDSGKLGEELLGGVKAVYGVSDYPAGVTASAYKVSFKSTQLESKPLYTNVAFYRGLYDNDGKPIYGGALTEVPNSNPVTYNISTYSIKPKLKINFPSAIKEHIDGIKIYKYIGGFTTASPTTRTLPSSNANAMPEGMPTDEDITNPFKAISGVTVEYDIVVTAEDRTRGYVTWEDTSFTSFPPTANSTAPTSQTRLDGGEPGITRDATTKRITGIKYSDQYGVGTTGTGVSDIAIYQTKTGTYYQKHSAAFITGDEFMTKNGFNPSRWTNKYHLSNIYVLHSGDGYRGMLSDAVVVDNVNIVNADILIVNEGSTDPKFPETRYKYFKISAPYRFLDSSPNYSCGIAIKME